MLNLAERIVKEGERLGFEDTLVIARRSRGTLSRFSDKGVALNDSFDSSEVSLNAGKEGRKVVAHFTIHDSDEICKELKRLPNLLKVTDPLAIYAALPTKIEKYRVIDGLFDKRVGELNHFEIMRDIINNADGEKVDSIAGTLTLVESEDAMCTSQGQEGCYKRSEIELNLRAFADKEASGQGIAVSTAFDKFDYLGATRKACREAKMAEKPVNVDPGKWEVLLAPPVVANLFGEVGMFASAYYVDAGISFLAGKLGNKISMEGLDLFDWGNVPYGLASSPFDWEGTPTRQTRIISKGVLSSYLHNLTTAKRFNTESTGNAGWVVPEPTNLVIAPGTETEKSLLKKVSKGIYITNNWYTRYQNYREGTFSSVGRDAAFLIESGEIKKPLKGIRISDSLPSLLSNICSVSKERYWVRWWDAEVPVLAPFMLVNELGITTPSCPA
ncbi:MAG TPA: TldD/PmbA family protein [Thermoplasmata archaeon]|nr:TldD/PmbA family protein [Thermoplasmata archaeon]